MSTADLAPAGRGPRSSVALLAALGVTLTAYSAVVSAPFAWDDHLLIEEASHVHEFHPLQYFIQPFWRAGATRDAGSYFRPLVILTYAGDWKLSGGKPWLFHLTNLLAHLAASSLVFAVSRRGGARAGAAGVAAALFGTLPRATESVAWISGRTDLLAACFVLIALLLHDRARAGRRWGSAVTLFGALLCKEVALAGAVAIAAGEWVAARRGEQSMRRAVSNVAPVAVAVACWGVLRAVATHGGRGLLSSPQPADLNRPIAVFQTVGQYLLMALDPLRPRLLVGLLGEVQAGTVALGIAAVIGLAVGAVLFLRRPPTVPVAVGLTLAATALAMVSHVIPINVATIAADRFLYLPAAGVAIAGAVAWRSASSLAQATAALGAVALTGAFGCATYMRIADWTDEVRLWRVAVETTPTVNPLPRIELGNALRVAGRLEEAVPQYRQALLDAPGRLRREALINLGTTLSDLGRLEEAGEAMRGAISVGPELAIDHYNLGVLEARRLQFDTAETELRRALALAPGYPDAEAGLRFVAAARQMSAALAPESPEEPTEMRLARARLWAYLGVPSRATPLFASLAERPDLGPGELSEAAGYLLRRLDRPGAESLLSRVLATRVSPAEKARLTAMLEDRFGRSDRSP